MCGEKSCGKECRKTVLLEAAYKLLKQCKESGYVKDALCETVFYDGVECDGYCLMGDIGDLLDGEVPEGVPLVKEEVIHRDGRVIC